MNRLDNQKQLETLDSLGMLGTLDLFPSQCWDAIQLGSKFEWKAAIHIDRIVVCGMGGSAMAGEIVCRFSRVPSEVVRGYHLPTYIDDRTLVIAISYSGNTVETLSCLEQGINAGSPALIISSGGRIEEIGKAEGISSLKIPSGYQPRAAMGYLALPLLVILSRLDLLVEIGSWESVLHELNRVKERCTFSVPSAKNPAKQLAHALNGRIPLIYGTVGNSELVAMRWKTQINENAKQAAFWNAFPELNHNEIVALTRANLLPNQHVLLLANDYDFPENRLRREVMKPLFEKNGVSFTEVSAEGEGAFAQIFSQIYFGDYVSTYLAFLNEVDPAPVALIEEFKGALAQRTSQLEGEK